MKKNLDIYFTRIYIIKAFVIALLLSTFIYLSYFEMTFRPLNSLLAMVGFYLLLGENRMVWFWSGLFIGIMWFYWISFSFVYYDLSFMIPFVILGVALTYAILFWIIGRVGHSIYVQLPLLFGVSFIDPFGFNWLKLELTLIDTYFSTTQLSFALFLSGLTLLKALPKWFKILSLLPLLGALYHTTPTVKLPQMDVALPVMHIPQSQRWDAKYQQEAIDLNFGLIEDAISEKKALIIFPESSFTLYLNRAPRLIEEFK